MLLQQTLLPYIFLNFSAQILHLCQKYGIILIGDAHMEHELYKLTILLVDDNKELLQMIHNILIQAGFQNIKKTYHSVYSKLE